MSLPRAAVLAVALLVPGCDVPPPESYVTGGRGAVAAAARPAGANAVGEPCVVQPVQRRETDPEDARAYELFCGAWQQPAARLFVAASGDMDALASSGIWRRGLDQRAACGPPRRTAILGGDQALLFDCTRRAGGWPHVALVARSSAGTIMADGVLPALPAIEGAASVLAGGSPPAAQGSARSAALALAAQRLATESFTSTDISQFEELMRLGNGLNQAENFAEAENAYRAALALHERVLGPENPGSIGAAMALALQLSNQGRILEADALLARADARAASSPDPLLPGRLLHYRAMHAGNQRDNREAERLILRAEALLRAQVPETVLAPRARGGSVGLAEPALADRALLADAAAMQALAAYVEARRYHAVVLRRLGRTAEAEEASREARALANSFATDSPVLAARAARTEGDAARSAGDSERAAVLFGESARLFARSVPEERPVALARFRAGAALADAGRRQEALAQFREGARILGERRLGLSADAVMPYLDTLSEEAATARDPAPLAEEMFAAAQLIRGGITARLIAQATARLGAAEGGSGASAAIRRLQDAEERLATLYAQRDAAMDEGREPRALAALDREIATAQGARAAAEEEVQAAAPGYRQLVLGTTTASDARARLGEGEALALIVAGERGGHTLLLDRAGIVTGRIGAGEQDLAALVGRVRGSTELRLDGPGGSARLPEFDTAAAHALWQGLFGPLSERLATARSLVVVPSGALLSLPFGLLPTEAPRPGAAPAWLVARMAVTHMPSVQSFVSLRGAATPSRAARAYLGFGDFVPPTPAAVAASFPPGRCDTDAAAVRGLSALPGTRAEIEAARRLLGAPASDVVTGAAFIPAAVRARSLSDYRIVHFAAHAVLPSEILCLAEPAILASTPSGGNAAAAFLPASEIIGLSMDADLAILSACNSGGEGGNFAGESLSGLARAFFYAGARGLVVTHWSVDDTASALLVADTLRRIASGSARAADALRAAQLAMIADAGAGRLPAVFAHPFFWAGFALVGDGGTATRASG